MAIKFYGSVNNESNLIVDLYGGRDKKARRITKLYGAVEGEAYHATWNTKYISMVHIDTFMSKFNQSAYSSETITGAIVSKITPPSTTVYTISFGIYTEEQGFHLIGTGTLLDPPDTDQWGIYVTLDFFSPEDCAGQIYITKSDYSAKLIHQGFGHLNYT